MSFLHSLSGAHSLTVPATVTQRCSTAQAAEAISQARFVGEVITFIRLMDGVQSLFFQKKKQTSFSRYIRWFNKRYYLPLQTLFFTDFSLGIILKCP